MPDTLDVVVNKDRQYSHPYKANTLAGERKQWGQLRNFQTDCCDMEKIKYDGKRNI